MKGWELTLGWVKTGYGKLHRLRRAKGLKITVASVTADPWPGILTLKAHQWLFLFLFNQALVRPPLTQSKTFHWGEMIFSWLKSCWKDQSRYNTEDVWTTNWKTKGITEYTEKCRQKNWQACRGSWQILWQMFQLNKNGRAINSHSCGEAHVLTAQSWSTTDPLIIPITFSVFLPKLPFEFELNLDKVSPDYSFS